jgi:uncharacterized membrane protein YeaQ/YmgE (transglycosylase-associated protein family)
MYVLSWIFFGAFTGWIAGLIVNKRGEGCILNTALGLVGGWLFRQLTGFHYEEHGFFISAFVAVIGAIIVLLIYYAITGSRTLR